MTEQDDKCPTCEGSGRIPTCLFDAIVPSPLKAPNGAPCKRCEGTGKLLRVAVAPPVSKAIYFHIPAKEACRIDIPTRCAKCGDVHFVKIRIRSEKESTYVEVEDESASSIKLQFVRLGSDPGTPDPPA